MEKCNWTLMVKIMPIEFQQPRQAILRYMESRLNTHVSELNGILVGFDKLSFQLVPPFDLATVHQPTNISLVHVHAEVPFLVVHVCVLVTVFRPEVGSELDAIVNLCKPYSVICRCSQYSLLLVSLVRSSDDGCVESCTGERVQLSVGEKVRLKLTTLAKDSTVILRGQLLSVMNDELGDEPDATAALEDVSLPKKKKQKRSHNFDVEQGQVLDIHCGSGTPDNAMHGDVNDHSQSSRAVHKHKRKSVDPDATLSTTLKTEDDTSEIQTLSHHKKSSKRHRHSKAAVEESTNSAVDTAHDDTVLNDSKYVLRPDGNTEQSIQHSVSLNAHSSPNYEDVCIKPEG